jgi:hypothetical protein
MAAVLLQVGIWGGLFQLRFAPGEWERMRAELPAEATSGEWLDEIVASHGLSGLVVWWFDTHGEVRLYHRYAQVLVSADQTAYRSVPMEYQPGALAVLVPPAWVASDYNSYLTAFVWWCGLLHVATLGLALVWWHNGRPWSTETVGRAGVLSAVFLLVFGGVAAARFDHVVPVLVLGSLVLLRLAERRNALGLFAAGGGLIAVGVLTKIVPGASLAVVLAWLAWERPTRWMTKAVGLVGGFGVAFLGLHGLFYAWWGEAYLASYSYHAERGLQIESTWAGVMRLFGSIEVVRDHGAHHLVTTATDTVKLLSLVAFGTVGLAFLWRAKGAVGAWFPATLGLLLTAMVTSTVLSPQYLLWLGGPVMVAAAGKRAWRPGAVLLLVAAGLSQALVPKLYDMMVAGQPLVLVLLNLRNGILVTLLVWLWWRLPTLAASE